MNKIWSVLPHAILKKEWGNTVSPPQNKISFPQMMSFTLLRTIRNCLISRHANLLHIISTLSNNMSEDPALLGTRPRFGSINVQKKRYTSASLFEWCDGRLRLRTQLGGSDKAFLIYFSRHSPLLIYSYRTRGSSAITQAIY